VEGKDYIASHLQSDNTNWTNQ